MQPQVIDRELESAAESEVPDEPVDISVILPAYNEEGSVDGVCAQVTAVLGPTEYSYEIIFIDDGSTDSTWSKLQRLVSADYHVRALRHRRNFGKASALANGFTFARGDIMVTSDADMQYDPADILRLVEKLIDGGYDVVSAYKVVRRDPIDKRLASWFFNFFVRSTTGIELHDINAGLKAFRREAAEDLVRYGYGELHRFFIIVAARRGFSVAEVPVESQYRMNGRSKYGSERYLRGALDFLTVIFLSGYGERPLHFLGTAGLTLAGIGSAILAYLGVATTFVGRTANGSVLLPVAVLLIISGVQMLMFGLIAEMINNLERVNGARSKISQALRFSERAIKQRRRRTDVGDAEESGPRLDRRRVRLAGDALVDAVCSLESPASPRKGTGLSASAERLGEKASLLDEDAGSQEREDDHDLRVV